MTSKANIFPLSWCFVRLICAALSLALLKGIGTLFNEPSFKAFFCPRACACVVDLNFFVFWVDWGIKRFPEVGNSQKLVWQWKSKENLNTDPENFAEVLKGAKKINRLTCKTFLNSNIRKSNFVFIKIFKWNWERHQIFIKRFSFAYFIDPHGKSSNFNSNPFKLLSLIVEI